MCPSISATSERQSAHPSSIALWPKTSLLVIVLLFLSNGSFAQGQDEIDIRTIDMRGQNPVSASVAAIKNSRNDVVVILMKGASEELIQKTKDNLKALVQRGYDRLGIILCDFKPEETLPVIGIVSDGTIYTAIKGAQPDAKTMKALYDSVAEVYKNNVLPKLENSQSQKN